MFNIMFVTSLKSISKTPIRFRSYFTLSMILVFGITLVTCSYFYLIQPIQQEYEELKHEKKELQEYIQLSGEIQQRLQKPENPNESKLLLYAHKVPKDRELPRFLYQLHQITGQLGITLNSLTINEDIPITKDYLTEYLGYLTELSKGVHGEQSGEQSENTQEVPALTPEEAKKQEAQFITHPNDFVAALIKSMGGSNPDSTSDPEEEVNLEQNIKQLEKYIPIGMITLTLNCNANYDQLKQFFTKIDQLPRTIHIEGWSYQKIDKEKLTTNPVVDVKLHIFYYKNDLEEIPSLPPLKIEEDFGKAPIRILPTGEMPTQKTP
jgi:Tfp pilus assembly protein PilO